MITNFLLPNARFVQEKYQTELLFVQTEPVGEVFTKRLIQKGTFTNTFTKGPIFHCTDRARKVDKKFIIWR